MLWLFAANKVVYI